MSEETSSWMTVYIKRRRGINQSNHVWQRPWLTTSNRRPSAFFIEIICCDNTSTELQARTPLIETHCSLSMRPWARGVPVALCTMMSPTPTQSRRISAGYHFGDFIEPYRWFVWNGQMMIRLSILIPVLAYRLGDPSGMVNLQKLERWLTDWDPIIVEMKCLEHISTYMSHERPHGPRAKSWRRTVMDCPPPSTAQSRTNVQDKAYRHSEDNGKLWSEG